MTFTPILARTADEARKKALGGRADEEWDDDHESLTEVDGNPI